MYMHNISGGRSKIPSINHHLANTHFDSIALQESWFNSEVHSQEVIHSTDFSINRRDRSEFDNTRNAGGSAVTFVKTEFTVEEIRLLVATITEFVATKITRTTKSIYLINCYLPPNRKQEKMYNEITLIVQEIRNNDSQANIILLGDFNYPSIEWEYSDEGALYLTPRDVHYSKREMKFINTIADLRLCQINHLRNSRGRYLDLVFADSYETTECFGPNMTDNFDKNSIHHNSVGINISFPVTNQIGEVDINYTNVNTKRFALELNRNTLPGERMTLEQLDNLLFRSSDRVNNIE